MDIKTCTKCNTEKSLDQFHKFKNSKDGFKHHCKQCCKNYRIENAHIISQKEKEYRKNNAEKYKNWSTTYYQEHQEQRREYSKMYRDAMSDEQKEDITNRNKDYCKNYYQENKEKMNEASKRYAAEHKEQIASAHKKYRAEHKEKLSEKRRQRERERMLNDEQYKTMKNLRKLVYMAIKNNSQSGRGVELLGCSVEEFKIHFSYLFDKNMSWDNYGSYWQIDHIEPVCRFDLMKKEDQEICFNYGNLQPLTVEDNRKKGSNFI